MDNSKSKKPERRKVRFNSISDALKEIDAIEEADRRGTLVAIGSWTPGQILAHLASWIEYGYDGYPMSKPFFLIRWILRWKLNQVLNDRMDPGIRIPGVPQGTYGMDPMDLPAAAQRLRKAFQRLQSGETCKFDSPAFGQMSHEDRIRLNLRHAELHLSFLKLTKD